MIFITIASKLFGTVSHLYNQWFDDVSEVNFEMFNDERQFNLINSPLRKTTPYGFFKNKTKEKKTGPLEKWSYSNNRSGKNAKIFTRSTRLFV